MIVELRTIVAVFLGALCASMAFAAEGDSDSILVRFNMSAGQWALPHDAFFRPGTDLETNLDKDGKLLTVRIDLNGDGVPEYFLRTLCGNGGCEYPIFDGRTHAFLGSVFGSEAWLLRRRSHALPVIETFGHVAATFLARSIPTVIMLMDFPFRGFDVIEQSHCGTWCRSRLPPQPRDGEVPFIRWATYSSVLQTLWSNS